jgi:hypothetical protein
MIIRRDARKERAVAHQGDMLVVWTSDEDGRELVQMDGDMYYIL